ncbi:hypothetical protein LTR37_010551 [Vermiconidia calcicola]|uniref:Uncharacterized protein n=1 Tax=Vermiconidia calcicola TaxID=1690605 RepID=A0ACC3N4L6_9PEZI|nr:hypothetical protein LTR37_010551 [Vermiconidia calcicola]
MKRKKLHADRAEPPKRRSERLKAIGSKTSTVYQRHQPTLLGLPGELRNKIYRNVLLERHAIRFTSTSCQQPSMLQTCWQIRTEATPIFYEENKFEVEVVDLACAPHSKHWRWNDDLPVKNVSICFKGQDSWSNFLGWLKKYHNHEVRGLDVGADIGDVGAYYGNVGAPYGNVTLEQAFYIVDSLIDLPWTRVEEVLNAYKKAVNTREEEPGFTD